LIDEPERVRPDGDAGEEKSDNGRYAQPLRDDDDGDSDRDEDDEVAKNRDFAHGQKLVVNQEIEELAAGSSCW
jgi:hypothetical protein